MGAKSLSNAYNGTHVRKYVQFPKRILFSKRQGQGNFFSSQFFFIIIEDLLMAPAWSCLDRIRQMFAKPN